MESTIQDISVRPDFYSPIFRHWERLKRVAPLQRDHSFPMRSPRSLAQKSGFGFALIFPVISPVGIVLLTSRNQNQLIVASAIPGYSNCLGLTAVFAMMGAEQELQLFARGVG